jgi:hypothetical protein
MSETKISSALNFHKENASFPYYHYRKLYPANGQATTIYLQDNGTTQNVLWNIPTEVINMGETYLEYYLDIVDQGANNYACIFKDTYGEYDSVLYRDTGNQYIVEDRFTNIVNHIENRLYTSDDELRFNDDLHGLVRTNALLSDVKSKRSDNSINSLAMIEPQHIQFSPIGTNAAAVSLTIPRKIYLKDLVKESFFDMAKNFILPVESYLDINFVGNRIGHLCTSAVDSTQGNAVLANQTIAGNTYAVAIRGLVLNLALEQNQDLVVEMKKQVKSGLSVPIPWKKAHSVASSQAAPFTFNQTLDSKQHGRKIKDIVYAPMAYNPAAGSKYLTYNHVNNASANDAAHVKLSTYQTSLDSAKLQRDIIQCPTAANLNLHDDWMLHKRLLKDSCYFNQPMYNYNWIHVDKFDFEQLNHSKDGSIMVDGYDLVKPTTYTVDVLTGCTSQVQNFLIVHGQKLLTITESSFVVTA